MKKIFYCLLLIGISVSTGLKAQQKSAPGKLAEISSAEASSYSRMTRAHVSGLINNYDLKYHRFQWLVDPSQSGIRGSVTSYYLPTVPQLSTIQFELAAGMSADSSYHRGFKVATTHVGDIVTVSYGEMMPEGVLDSVTVYYHGDPAAGNGFGSFGTALHNGVPALWTLSEPYGASDWWPSKNDLTDKIDSIDVFIAYPKGNHAASNGILVSETPRGANLMLSHWKHRYPIASYLVAIAVTNYARYTEEYTGAEGHYPIVNYMYPEDSASNRVQTSWLLPVYGIYSSLFGHYPFDHEKYGHAEFGWGGGMEHQTMTFIGQGAFNLEILSHELSHQWFGDMVTCGSWHDIWLNEGFATYCAGLMYENTSPDHYWPIWKMQNISWVCYYPNGSVYCTDTTNVNTIFDSRLSYSKGGMVLHQLRWIIGDSAFFAGMKSYLADPKLRYGFAMTSDYKAHMETASGRDLTEYFNDWIYQQGYPSYTVNCTQDAAHLTTVVISQAQSDPSVSFFKLPVPVQFFGSGKDTLLVFNNTFSGQSFMVNPGFAIDSMHFDPYYRIISANNHVALGEEELPAGKTLSLSPNPAGDRLTALHNLGIISEVGIVSINGQNMSSHLIENSPSRLVLDVSPLPEGTYILRLKKNGINVARKFVILR